MVLRRPISSNAPRFASPGKASVHEGTKEHHTIQKGVPETGVNSELGVGEMEGAKFKIEPLHRSGEDPNTMRARLLCSRHNKTPV